MTALWLCRLPLRLLPKGFLALALRITNDGEGFDVDNPPRRGVGLASFRERCARVGARLHIESEQGSEGTAVSVVVPLVDALPKGLSFRGAAGAEGNLRFPGAKREANHLCEHVQAVVSWD